MSLIHCVYASEASDGFDERGLIDILRTSRDRNASARITGILLYVNKSFFQVLEGDEDRVDPLVARITQDERHRCVTIIIRERIAQRSFADWSMGFATLTAADVGAIVGQNDFFAGASCFTALSDGRAKKLLIAFKNGRWRARIARGPSTQGHAA